MYRAYKTSKEDSFYEENVSKLNVIIVLFTA